MEHAPAEVVETHVSTVFMAGDRAYKLLKPITTGFLDHADATDRMMATEVEYALNRRIAPDVYLGLADVVEGGELVDKMIVMRRLPTARRLSQLVDSDEFPDQLIAVARRVAAFHAGLDPIHEPDGPGTFTGIVEDWRKNFDEMEQFVGPILDRASHDEIVSRASAYLDGRKELFVQREQDGLVRDVHGDLLADDIFCLDGGPRILDCLAFSRRLRVHDVLADIAFLVMDIDRLAGPGAARLLLRHYQEFSDEHHPSSLAHFHVAYRSLVRTKVACLRAAQGDRESVGLARRHHDMVRDHLLRATVRLVLVGGAPGTGKSTLAESLCERYDWSLLSSDELRKDMAGLGHTESAEAGLDAGIYQSEFTTAVYDELLREARLLIRRGESVVIDASFPRQRARQLARAVAAEEKAELIELECRADAELAADRIAARAARGPNPSDVNPELARRLAAARDQWESALAVDASTPPEDMVARVANHLVTSL
ncbi:MAG: AAA family ATPase [Actinomycetia bacterium]|nr:AAA family ATPase [Actinomycetes bacterium]